MAAKNKKFIVNEELIRAASDYIPYIDKLTIVSETAWACLEPVDKETAEIAAETQLPIPQQYKERCGAKQYFLMYYFLTRYLHITIDESGWSAEEYDHYASSHIFNQLERYKSGDMELRIKVFDILYDYKTLKTMLETEIYNLKEARNSALDRLQQSIELFSTPENVAKLNDLMQKTIVDVDEAQKQLAQKRGQSQNKSKQTEE